MPVRGGLLAPRQEPEAGLHHAIRSGLELRSGVYPSLPEVALQHLAHIHVVGLESEHDDPLVGVDLLDHVAKLAADQPRFRCLSLEGPLHCSSPTAVSHMIDHDIVVPLYGTVEGGSGPDARVEAL